jgi:hypothetical protein
MKRKRIYLILGIVFTILSLFFFTFLQIVYFNFQNKNRVNTKLAQQDIETLKDTLISWGKFPYSPLAYDPKEWWVDVVLYNEEKDRILFIANVIQKEESQMPYNSSKWILGFRGNKGIHFYVSESTQMEFLIEKTVDKKEISWIARANLVKALYYSFTFIERKDFWKFLVGHEKIIKEVQEREMREWKASRREQDSLKAAK